MYSQNDPQKMIAPFLHPCVKNTSNLQFLKSSSQFLAGIWFRKSFLCFLVYVDSLYNNRKAIRDKIYAPNMTFIHI